MNRTALLIASAALAGVILAQTGTPVSLVTESKNTYNGVKRNLLAASEKMPEDAYSFKPTDGQESFGQRIAHVSNQYRTCGAVLGEQKTVDTAKTAKADLVAALKASFDVCDAAWETMNDKTAMETISGGRGGQRTKLGALIGNTNHDSEMYGYISVYMRLKNVTPPSSDRKQ